MKIVKYILNCIANIFDAVVGKGENTGFKDALVGLSSIFIILLIFWISFFILHKKTKLKFTYHVILSIVMTIIAVLIIFLLLIIYEKIFLI